MQNLLAVYRRKLGEVLFGIEDHDTEEVSLGTTVGLTVFIIGGLIVGIGAEVLTWV